MFNALEADLYYCRDTFPSALAEYDEVCERHHNELRSGIRDALMEKFGEVPLLETYRQAAIRHQKNRDWQTALLWAERGIAMYGDEASRREWVEDLLKRAKSYRSKISAR